MMRTKKEIVDELQQVYDFVWYQRHRELVTLGMREPNDAARIIEEKYGWENLAIDFDEEESVMDGRILALAWVLGIEWDELVET